MIPADFILPLQSHNPIGEHHAQLASNCFGQTQALMQGRTFDEALAELADSPLSEAEKQLIAKHKVMEGNKPSNTLLMDKLTPITLGALIALYEHRTLVQGAIWISTHSINGELSWVKRWGMKCCRVSAQSKTARIWMLPAMP